MIPFNRPAVTGREIHHLQQALKEHQLSGDNFYTKECHKWLKGKFGCLQALLTTSCTSALEMAAILADIQPGDEVIMPSYTFVSTANAFVLRGAKVVFVDIRQDTMNIDETKIEVAITEKTKAIVPVHYAGVACNMDVIMDIANRYKLLVIEDAAQGITSQYKGRWLGSIGHLGCYSFHETKNISCGEGGGLFINDEQFIERAEIIREKGTDRSRFFRGQVDKYSWVDIGSSYLPSELNAAYLFAQFEMVDAIQQDRISTWNRYYKLLQSLEDEGYINLPHIPPDCVHNAHMFYIKVRHLEERTALTSYLKQMNISAVFHYIPLHSSHAGLKFSRFNGEDKYTTVESEKLLRLPFFYGVTEAEINKVAASIHAFYKI